MTEQQENVTLPPDSLEVRQLKEYTNFYEERFARDLMKKFPEFTEEQAKKAIEFSHEEALDIARKIIQIEQAGGKDSLTGLDNRDRFAKDARIEIANAIREGRKLSILFVDIDRFKSVNDESSHATGDEILRQVTHNLLTGSRSGDRFARLGGEEILCLLNLVGDKAIEAAERRRRDLEQSNISYVAKSGELRKITVSIGVATFDPNNILEDKDKINDEVINRELNTLVRLADMAMYTAKEGGRNRVGIAKPDGNFATLDPRKNGNGNALTPRQTPNFPSTDEYFKLTA